MGTERPISQWQNDSVSIRIPDFKWFLVEAIVIDIHSWGRSPPRRRRPTRFWPIKLAFLVGVDGAS